MILKDLKIERLEKQEDWKYPRYRFFANLVIKRHGKLWTVRHLMDWDASDDSAEQLLWAIQSFIDRCKKGHYLFKINEEDIKRNMENINLNYPRHIGGLPFEIEDEEITKEQYEERFGKL